MYTRVRMLTYLAVVSATIRTYGWVPASVKATQPQTWQRAWSVFTTPLLYGRRQRFYTHDDINIAKRCLEFFKRPFTDNTFAKRAREVLAGEAVDDWDAPVAAGAVSYFLHWVEEYPNKRDGHPWDHCNFCGGDYLLGTCTCIDVDDVTFVPTKTDIELGSD